MPLPAVMLVDASVSAAVCLIIVLKRRSRVVTDSITSVNLHLAIGILSRSFLRCKRGTGMCCLF